jgi:hypothetical protein
VIRIEVETLDLRKTRHDCDSRHYISSLSRDRLTPEQWLRIIRERWGVETTHQILDTALLEDAYPWIEASPRAAYAVAVLRRIAYTLLALFRSVTQRSEARRAVPWKHLLEDIRLTLVTLASEHVANLRRRNPAPVTS